MTPERRAPSTLATGRLNQGVPRRLDTRSSSTRAIGRAATPYAIATVSSWARKRGTPRPGPSPWHPRLLPEGLGHRYEIGSPTLRLRPSPSTPVAECPASPNMSSADHASVLTMPSLPENERAFLESTTMPLEAQDAVALFI
jgi:hypothetical protein